MKYFIRLALVIIALVNLAISKNIADSCRKVSLKGSILHAECQQNNRSYMKTTVDLNNCVGNNNGRLVKGNKKYTTSCSSCMLMSSRYLGCMQCTQKNGGKVQTEINLSNFITNDNGEFKGCGSATFKKIYMR